MQNKFIVLEKDDDIRSLYRRKLEQKFRDCVVIEAASCVEAVDSLGREPVDAILVNQAALDARGVEMVQAIRRADRQIPLISIGDPPQQHASIENGADIFVATADWETVGQAVEQVLEREKRSSRRSR